MIRSVIQVHPRELYSEVRPDRDVRLRHHYGTRSTIQSPPTFIDTTFVALSKRVKATGRITFKCAIPGSTQILWLLRRRLSLIIIPESVCGVSEIFYAFLWFLRHSISYKTSISVMLPPRLPPTSRAQPPTPPS